MCKLRVTGEPQRDGSIDESQSEEHVSVPRAAVTKVSSCPFGGSSPKNKNIPYLGWGGELFVHVEEEGQKRKQNPPW